MFYVITAVLVASVVQMIVRDFEDRGKAWQAYQHLLQADLQEGLAKLYSQVKGIRRHLRANIRDGRIEARLTLSYSGISMTTNSILSATSGRRSSPRPVSFRTPFRSTLRPWRGISANSSASMRAQCPPMPGVLGWRISPSWRTSFGGTTGADFILTSSLRTIVSLRPLPRQS